MNRDAQAEVPTSPEGDTVHPVPAGPRATGKLVQWAAAAIRRHIGDLPVRLRLWNDSGIDLGPDPVATLRVADRGTLVDLLRDPDMQFGELFMKGRLEVDGDLVAMLESIFRAKARRGKPRAAHHANPPAAARDNVHHHYDLGNDFYSLWLDRQLLYTCAYFPTPDVSLEDAQVAKMDLVCRKLRLQPGERVVEAGCGWGALALHMARHHGVIVQACNLSHEQIRYARNRADREGLASRVTFLEADYRELREPADVFVSVGMLEHVGPADYGTLGGVIRRVLGNGTGRGLLHFIGRTQPAPLDRWIARRIFPGAYPPTLGEAVAGVLQPEDYAVLDVENLRLHYAATIDHWRRRYIGALDTVRRRFDLPFSRAWLLYLSGAQAGFLAGSMELFQVVFAPARSNAIPWIRCT